MASSINASTSGAGGVITTADNTGILNLQTAGTTAVTVNASQNVGIGTTSPSYKLDVRGNIVGGNGTIQTAITWDTMGSIGTLSNHGLRLITNSAIAATIDTSQNFQFNSGYGSVATAYGCRAWVNFNGTGTVAIRASGNVSSITDNNVGQYTVNFTTSMPDTNYAVSASAEQLFWSTAVGSSSYATSSVLIRVTGETAYRDVSFIGVSIFR